VISDAGAFRMHMADGTGEGMRVIYGQDVRSWSVSADPERELRRGVEAWAGVSRSGAVRVFKSTWENPRPEVSVETVDFSAAPGRALVMIAVTAEP
jgi:hypothetical protein